jgi:hypothetical protein
MKRTVVSHMPHFDFLVQTAPKSPMRMQQRANMLLLLVYLLVCAVGRAENHDLQNLRRDARALQVAPLAGQFITIWSRSSNPAKFAPLRHGAATGVADDALVVFGGLDINSK